MTILFGMLFLPAKHLFFDSLSIIQAKQVSQWRQQDTHLANNSTCLRSPQHAADSTEEIFVQNRHANFPMCAINVTKDIPEFNATARPVLSSFLKHVNPLPTNIISQVNTLKLSALLSSHPDKYLVQYVMDGLSNGFDIGFNGISSITRPRNLLSSCENKIKISEAIDKELVRGHTSGPFPSPPFYNLHCSPIGAVIKKDRSCRLVMDLSQPQGSSINEYISKEEFSVKHTHFDEATALVRTAGRSSLLSKVDIRHAFRLLPLRPQDWKLLGYMWEGCYFIDTRLPFGLRSSPGIFNHFAELICWVLQKNYGTLY